MPSLSPDVRAIAPDLVSLRRELHAHPELAFAERRTAARVAEILSESGLEVRTGVGRTGVVASLPGPRGRTVLLRADMDGLPIVEQGDAPYVSRNQGVMHACGHDGHVAMAASAARLLARRSGRAGTVRFVFQPAEEGEGGAQAVIGDGVLEGVDVVLGLHLWNELPVGTLGVKAGPLMAAVDRLRIAVRGRGGHGAIPH